MNVVSFDYAHNAPFHPPGHLSRPYDLKPAFVRSETDHPDAFAQRI